jgi:signal transduction histidine kinase
VGRVTPLVLHDPEELHSRGLALSMQLGRTVEGGAVLTEPATLHQPREKPDMPGRVRVRSACTACQLRLALGRRRRVDATRLNQILTNLLANAIKFTECGGVKLTVAQVASGVDGVRLRFAVRDSGIGIGISPEVQGMLFEPFTQADTGCVPPRRGFGRAGR